MIDDEDSSRETSDDLAVGGRLRDLSSSPITIPVDEDEDNENSRHGNIRAQRLIQSIKRIKKADGGALFWEGWMIHTTDKDLLTEKKYYWRVDASYVDRLKKIFRKKTRFFSSFITMYHNETTNKFSRELPLEHVILQLNTNEQKIHYFEIRTEQNLYFCGCKRSRNRVREAKSSSHLLQILSFSEI